MQNMTKNTQTLIEQCSDEGLYLIFDDSTILPLTKGNIEKASADFWNDCNCISDSVKQAAEFQRCDFCPLKKTGGLCDAIRPTMPFLDDIDKYMSHDEVITVYNDGNSNLTVNKTTMQVAMQYLSILSLMYYCRIGRAYWKNFLGITPTMTSEQIAFRLYLNFYYLNNGNMQLVKEKLSEFRDLIFVTCDNQVKRMNMICKNDVFANAFVNTQVITAILSFDFDKVINEQFESSKAPTLKPLKPQKLTVV